MSEEARQRKPALDSLALRDLVTPHAQPQYPNSLSLAPSVQEVHEQELRPGDG